jgi:quinol monooxygenase YgiN
LCGTGGKWSRAGNVNRAVFTLYENWRSKQDLDQHLQMPYLQALLGQAEELFAEPPDIQLLERIG